MIEARVADQGFVADRCQHRCGMIAPGAVLPNRTWPEEAKRRGTHCGRHVHQAGIVADEHGAAFEACGDDRERACPDQIDPPLSRQGGQNRVGDRALAGRAEDRDTGPGEDAAGKASGPSGKSAESLRARFLKEHLAYIRNMIAEHLRYPSQARRMGWSGKLTIEFVIRESGGVDTIRVVKSSGFPLLDRDAEDTVRRSAPFPKPPVSARLVIPVEYLLE